MLDFDDDGQGSQEGEAAEDKVGFVVPIYIERERVRYAVMKGVMLSLMMTAKKGRKERQQRRTRLVSLYLYIHRERESKVMRDGVLLSGDIR